MKLTAYQYLARSLLLLLLPIIAAGLYLKGQRYDPGLIDFSRSMEGSAGVSLFFPDNIAGLSKSGEKEFSKDNLYEHINGHAEYFISAGFKSLHVADYFRAGERQPDVTAEIYDMGESAAAFGVLMDEATPDSGPAEYGFMGFQSGRSASFIKGRYFIKVSSFSDKAPVKELASEIDRLAGDIKTDVPQLERFPKEGAVPGKIKFIKENYRGLDFLGKVFEREYNLEGITFQAALIEGDEEGIKKTVGDILSFLKKEGIEHHVEKKGGRTFYKVSDPFEGEWIMVPGEKEMFLLYGRLSNNVLQRFL